MSARNGGATVDLPVHAAAGTTAREALWRARRSLQAGDSDRAEHELRQLLLRDEGCAEAWFFLGVISQRQGSPVEAIKRYENALRLVPDLAEAHNNLGVVLEEQGSVREAEAHFREAIGLMEDYPEAHNNLGNALQDQGRFTEALPAYRRALELRPGYLDAFKHLGNALRVLGRLDEAIDCYSNALRLAPDHVLLHMSRAMVWIQMGDLVRGWNECEWRLRADDSPIPKFAQPVWDGSALDGQSILIHAEQGLGDTIQFIRYVPMIAARGGRVIVACSPLLRGITGSCPGVAQVVTTGDPLPDFACYAPVLSLPRILGTTLQTIPARVPYLYADRERIARWRSELGAIEGIKLGIVWQGNPQHTRDRERSFRLAQLEPLARVTGVRLFSLQKNAGTDQIAAVANRFPVTDLGSRLEDFVDTAAALCSLDLVISPDSSPAHLAGALGVPVWLALPYVADWRWMSDRDDSPWYPTMRLFRQRRFGDWDEVFQRLAAELTALTLKEDRPAGGAA
jgi:Tfp pilus assembly protein PilF